MSEAGAMAGRGNQLLAREFDGKPALEKRYYLRRGALRVALARLSHRWLEGKRSPTPEGRWETEARSLELWRGAGVDVPAVYQVCRGRGGSPPSLVMEYVHGRLLFWELADPQTSAERSLALVAALARSCRARHALALREREPLLIHEHATTKHVLVGEGRLVTFDLEGGYRPDYPVAVAAGWEVAGLVRSLWQSSSLPSVDLTRAFAQGYGDRDQLRSVARAAYGRGVLAWARRASDAWRRALPKHGALTGLLALGSR